MKLIKAFFYTFKNSITNVAYYKDLLDAKLSFSIKYILVLGALATVVTTLAVSIPLIPEVNKYVGKGFNYAETFYPQDLEIKMKEGKWEINQEEPYLIGAPNLLEMGLFEDGEINPKAYEEAFPTNLIVFDHNGKINDLEEFDTLMLVNEANLIARTEQEKLEVYPIDSIPDGEFNVDVYKGLLEQFKGLARYLPAIIITFVFIGALFYYLVYRFAYLLLVALALLALGNIKGLQFNYSDYYKIAIHTMTLPLLLEVLFAIFSITVGAPFWFFGMNLIFGIVIVYRLANTKGEITSGESTEKQA